MKTWLVVLFLNQNQIVVLDGWWPIPLPAASCDVAREKLLEHLAHEKSLQVRASACVTAMNAEQAVRALLDSKDA